MNQGLGIAGMGGGGMAAQPGIGAAVQRVQSMGRAPDTMLAHITPDEASFIDDLQGGQRINPHTGLPEYGLFGNILKAIARAGAAIGGFMVAGPAGAAAASGAATKLTGGSWKEALGAAAMSGVGSLGAQGLSGGGWGLTTKPASALAGSTWSQAGGFQAPSMGTQFLNTAKSLPGIAAGMGGLSQPLESQGGGAPMQELPRSGFSLDVMPQNRTYQPYTGDPTRFAEPGQGGDTHEFYTPLNPKPIFKKDLSLEGIGYAGGGVVMGPQGPNDLARGIRGGGIDIAQPGGAVLGPQAPGIGNNVKQLQQAAIAGYVNAKDGGAIYGPGSGESDDIPAMLSAGEHVVDQDTVDLLGRGNNDRGHKVIERIKQEARRGHVADPKRPPAFQKKVARAKKRAGVK